MANEARWPAPLAAGKHYMALSHHMEEFAGLAMSVVVQWLADVVFWQGPVGPPGRAATCSHPLEKAVPGTCVLDGLEEGFGRDSGCLGTAAVDKRLVLEELDVVVRMASADDPL